ncbi:hypothetical protein HWV62_12322 [Athelia sp. TMB]|nr:hypothetical protein HWV62_12322 [Athelia sp. TMB]
MAEIPTGLGGSGVPGLLFSLIPIPGVRYDLISPLRDPFLVNTIDVAALKFHIGTEGCQQTGSVYSPITARTFNTQAILGGTVINANGNYIQVLGNYIEQACDHVNSIMRSVSEQSEVLDHLREAYSEIDVAHSHAHPPERGFTNQAATDEMVVDDFYTSAIESIAAVRAMIGAVRTMIHHSSICSSAHLLETLAELEKMLDWTKLTVQVYHHTPLSESLSRALSVPLDDCRQLLQQFMCNLADWRHSLSNVVLYLIQKYVHGKIGQSGLIEVLDSKLRECHKRFSACLLALGRAAWPGSHANSETLASLAEMHAWLDLESRTLQHIVIDAVTVVSHLGHKFPVPFIFCKSWRDFHVVITGFCRNSAGYVLIQRGDYMIWKSDDTIIHPTEISVKLRSGMRVKMSIVLHERVENRHRKEARRCPRCKVYTKQIAVSGWLDCPRLNSSDHQDIQYFRMINIRQEAARDEAETKVERVDVCDEPASQPEESTQDPASTVDKHAVEEETGNQENATFFKEVDAGEGKEGQIAMSWENANDQLAVSPGGIPVALGSQVLSSSPSSPPVPSNHDQVTESGTKAMEHLSESSTSSCQSSNSLETSTLSTEDIIIVVMGPTGAGKSSFISKATGSDDKTIGHGLESFTQHVRAVRCCRPDDPRSFVFVDTPGFDDTNLSDADILIRITSWLKETYQQCIYLTAILYLHRISDNRMTGSVRRNIDLFQRLCGNTALPNVVLVTTMWDEVDHAIAERREQELRDTFWRSMVANGSQTARFYHSPGSAWEILGPYTGQFHPVKLRIQKEMVDKGIPLSRTAAGFFLRSWLTVLSKQFKIFLARFQDALRNPSKQLTNYGRVDDLERKKLITQSNIEKVNVQINILTDQSSVYSDTSSTSTALFSTAPSTPTTPGLYSISTLLSRGGMKRDDLNMLAMYGM